MSVEQRLQNALDELRFPIENVDIRYFAMHQKRHARPFHAGENVADRGHVGYAAVGIRRRARRVELRGREDACRMAFDEIVGIRVVRQVAGHERRERNAGRKRVEDAPAIGLRIGRPRYRRNQIGHDDGSPEHGSGERQHRVQHIAVAKVEVPVVGPAQGQTFVH